MNKVKITFALQAVALCVLLMLSGCGGSQEPVTHTKGIYMLLDTSGTYAVELKKPRALSTISWGP